MLVPNILPCGPPSLSKSTYHSRPYYTIRRNRLDQSFLSVHDLAANSPPQNTSNHGIHFSFFLFFLKFQS